MISQLGSRLRSEASKTIRNRTEKSFSEIQPNAMQKYQILTSLVVAYQH